MATIQVKVIPSASRDGVVGRVEGAYKVKVQAAPEKGKANQAVLRVLAKSLGVPVQDLSIQSGFTSPFKAIDVISLSADQVAERLGW